MYIKHQFRARFLTLLYQYVPAAQEFVVGVVTARLGEAYRVDIGSAQPATLDFLAFEGASKRNRPNLKAREFASYRWSQHPESTARSGRWYMLECPSRTRILSPS